MNIFEDQVDTKWVMLLEATYLVLMLSLIGGLAFAGIGGTIHDYPIISNNPDAQPYINGDNAFAWAGAIALFIAICNNVFAKVRQHKQGKLQLKIAKLADGRQQAEWTRRGDEAKKERNLLRRSIRKGMISELTVIKDFSLGLIKAQEAYEKKETKFSSLEWVPVRPVFDNLGENVCMLDQELIKTITMYESGMARLLENVAELEANIRARENSDIKKNSLKLRSAYIDLMKGVVEMSEDYIKSLEGVLSAKKDNGKSMEKSAN